MVISLDSVDMGAKYYEVHSKEQLECLLIMERPDIVYCSDYYTKDEFINSVSIHSVLEELNVPFIGSTSATLEFVLSKSDLKFMWHLNKLSTPSFYLVHKLDTKVVGLEEISQATDYPYILKPNREGNSRGLDESSIVFDENSLKSKLDELLLSNKEVLVEKYFGNASDIREFTVAIIGNGSHKLLMPAEITLKQKRDLRIITTQDKDDHLTQATPVVDNVLNEKLIAFAEKAFEIAGVRDYSRCDVLLADGQLYAIEINGLPMIPDKWFEICASGVGLDSTQYINAIFLAGIVRNFREGKENLKVPLQMRQKIPTAILDVLLN
jgi:D-alanine-D-alanine ligase-like ATP-grasp enzyme